MAGTKIILQSTIPRKTHSGMLRIVSFKGFNFNKVHEEIIL